MCIFRLHAAVQVDLLYCIVFTDFQRWGPQNTTWSCCNLLCRSYRDRTGKNLSAWESLRPFIPICLQFTLFLLWAHNSPYNILSRQPRLLYLACGTVFSNIAVSFESFTWIIWQDYVLALGNNQLFQLDFSSDLCLVCYVHTSLRLGPYCTETKSLEALYIRRMGHTFIGMWQIPNPTESDTFSTIRNLSDS